MLEAEEQWAWASMRRSASATPALLPAYTKMASKSFGAPSQPSQSSRKGKKAWRKNVDIGEVEQGLEHIREEERVTGCVDLYFHKPALPHHVLMPYLSSALQKKADDELFSLDVAGDDKGMLDPPVPQFADIYLPVRAKTKKLDLSQLKSAKILAQRSAVPAVVSRVTSKDKDRMLRSVKRKRQDPLDAVVKQLPFGAGSAALDPSAAVKKSGQYDVWDGGDEDDAIDLTEEARDFIEPHVKKRKVKPPPTIHSHKSVEVAPILTPHEGTSYNPPVAAHNELLQKAVAVEEKRMADSNRYDAVHASMTALRTGVTVVDTGVDGTGMILDVPSTATVDSSDEEELEVVSVTPRLPKRKTLQQRKKAAKLRAAMAIAADKTAKKRMLAQMDSVKTFRRAALSGKDQHTVALAARKEAAEKKQRESLAGQRLGKHKVATGEIAVQLGDELGDSLRTLKVRSGQVTFRCTSR